LQIDDEFVTIGCAYCGSNNVSSTYLRSEIIEELSDSPEACEEIKRTKTRLEQFLKKGTYCL
jgi:hypothetical protein